MNISAEEKIMYKVMKALNDSGIPISFKGSMVLKACLLEAGFLDDTRHTVDIDGNWNSDTSPSGEQLVESIQEALNKYNIEIDVSIYRMYGEGRSAGFDFTDRESGEILFTMDIDVNRPVVPTRIYEIEDIKFRGVAPKQMIADKLSVISSDKVFRRIKDFVDMYYISHVFELDVNEVLKILEDSNRILGNFEGFINRTDELKHSYEKFRFSGGVNKPSFEDVYDSVKLFIKEILPNKA
ncbi:MAG: nucleotidyl transferase AbiEii/AbiGii toxin family protein [Lachnospiraceae bacterium]|nr:nucleotidyl transferase AbiEii/AbiGii toxin family protein [Lachnospiraceae bacterium]